jgi:hypothetical protein
MGSYSESPLARKIRALMAKANDKGVTEAEAASYAAKVQELLVKNGLSMSDVKEPDVERGDVEMQEQDEKKRKWTSPSRRALLRSVCRFYMCEAINVIGTKYWKIIGRPHNVEVAVSMTDYLIRTTIRVSNEWGRANIGSNVIDFRKGCMGRLAERLDEMRRQKTLVEKPVWKGSNPGNLPALFLSEQKLVENYMKERMNIKYKPQRPIRAGAAGFEAGRVAGSGMSLHGQVRHGGGRLMIRKGSS